MTTAVYKYPVPLRDDVDIALPHGAHVLSVLNQREELVLYAAVDTEPVGFDPLELVIRGTGHAFQGNEGEFIGSVSFADGSLIFHVFKKEAA
jgi:hypothetical protein